MNPELYKALTHSNLCIRKLTECFNKIIDDSIFPEDWKSSKTVMIPKVKKPKVNELRPIALTNISYKSFMNVAVRNKIEDHLRQNKEIKENQSGFTKKGRIENNLFILKYCIDNAFKFKKSLIVISIDFQKAYDSIKREKLISILKDYKINSDIINVISKIYEGDRTTINKGHKTETEIIVTSGIRQGCTGSTTLFKLITYDIIKKLEGKSGYQDELFKLTSLFYADDGLLLAQNVSEAKQIIDELIGVGEECGLSINKGKSRILIFNMKGRPKSIRGIDVVKQIKYLGITINDDKKCFRIHKKEAIEKADRMANITYPVISKSCNKILIGKTYWKSIVLPTILYGSNILGFTKTDIDKLQIIENRVYRHILGAPRYAQIPTLRGEIGASSMMARIMEGYVKYLKYLIGIDSNDLLRRITEERLNNKEDQWTIDIRNYCKELKLDRVSIASIGNEEIRKKILEWDSEMWRQELSRKSSLEIYRLFKKEIKSEENLYDNTQSSVIFYRCRTNNLNLKDRKRHSGGETKCELCNADIENLSNFFIVLSSL